MNIQANSPQKNINWKQIAIIAVILGVAAFQYIRTQPAGEEVDSGTGQSVAQLEIPDNLDLEGALKRKTVGNTKEPKTGQTSTSDNRDTAKTSLKKSNGPYLENGPRGTKVSPAGLVYTGSRSGEHRTEHVLRHAKDQPNRPGNHGVFDADGDDVFRLIDEAYGLIKKNSRQVSKDPPQDGKTAYLVDMKRRIGFRGGKSGNRAGKPAAKKMKLILAENRVITAYPY